MHFGTYYASDLGPKVKVQSRDVTKYAGKSWKQHFAEEIGCGTVLEVTGRTLRTQDSSVPNYIRDTSYPVPKCHRSSGHFVP